LSKKEKRPGLFKRLWNFFVNYFTLINFSWIEKEAKVLDKKFTPAHTEEKIFFTACPPIATCITRWKEHVPDRWEILVEVNDKKTFGPTLLCPLRRNDTPRWASVSKEAFEKASKGDKIKVKCFVSGQGMIYGVKEV